ncbi:hypothetical protein HHL22_15640 [Hymenobacter sp. RP-2-7]|uniref:Roadblock/LC7 domain-containing protein n=1 Tax=Hymenobacter polaris TaxID=2682546 RepID=A0A7Y0AG20_9BACT|nr:hypothetical protein [Hymenobacter polaris]NML66639.1 hypothetical protein [Hymenobacter polaris]
MRFPFFNRLQPKQIVPAASTTAARRAEQMLATVLAGLPELLLGYVFDLQGNALLASYTVSSEFNPHQLTVRNARLLQTVQQAVATGAWPGGPCTDLTVMLDEHMHYLRPLPELGWYCFAAVRLADANMGMVKEVLRRATAQPDV